jgi:hypothetical protein
MKHIDDIYTLPEAIARMEGWYGDAHNRCVRNCNPGNIEWGPFAESQGATGVEPDGQAFKGRFAVFPTADVGFAALRALLLGPSYKDLTIAQAINRYAPPSENATLNYVTQVCDWVGCKPTDIVWHTMTGKTTEEA